MKIDDLKECPWNPREVDDEALGGLATSLDKFGDISGIVFNVRLGYLVCGHQRLKALKKKYGDAMRLLDDNDEGTRLWVDVNDDGKDIREFPVRVVDWDERKTMLANLSANNEYTSGRWSSDLPDMIAALTKEDAEMMKDLRLDLLTPAERGDPDGSEVDENDTGHVTCPECGAEFAP